jgi:cation transport ATPase
MAVISLTMSRFPLSVGVAVHEGSTVLVVLNSLRLLRVRKGIA